MHGVARVLNSPGLRIGQPGLVARRLNPRGRESGGFPEPGRNSQLHQSVERGKHGSSGSTKNKNEAPIIHYFRPPVLIGATNDEDAYNLPPMMSAAWGGGRRSLRLPPHNTTTATRSARPKCVLNLPSADLVGADVIGLARTGSDPVPAGKVRRG